VDVPSKAAKSSKEGVAKSSEDTAEGVIVSAAEESHEYDLRVVIEVLALGGIQLDVCLAAHDPLGPLLFAKPPPPALPDTFEYILESAQRFADEHKVPLTPLTPMDATLEKRSEPTKGTYYHRDHHD
jgi:hypothetical protein